MIRNTVKVLVILLAGMALAGSAPAATIILDTSLVAPGVYFGNGNANSNFTVSQDGTTELGLSIIRRYVGPIDPGNDNVYTVPTGPPPFPRTGSAWGFEFSVNTRYNGGTAVLGNFLYAINVTDLTTGVIGPTSDPVRSIGDNAGFGTIGKTAGVTLSTQWGAQNSESPNFSQYLPAFDLNAPDLYKITFSQLSLDGLTTLGTVTVFADATAPEPSTFGLLAFALATLAFAARKR
jgi:PEP-CTERM motif